MKNKLSFILLFVGLIRLNVFANNVKPLSEPGTIFFTENKGQVHDLLNNPNFNILFTSNSGPFTVHFKRNGIAYQLAKIEEITKTTINKTNSIKSNKDKAESISLSLSKVELSWLNSNSNVTVTTDEALDAFDNYYLPSCPNGALNVKSYRGITMHNLYKGIDVHYYEKNGQLKHDYIVAPNSDYSNIKIKIEGAIIEKSKNGAIIIKTNIGTIEESAPISFQGGKQLESQWIINGNELSFEIKNYNPNLELIIDPLTRAWGYYLGGNLTDSGLECVTDASGNVYMTGSTASASNIASPGAFAPNLSGARDTYIVKYDFNGNRLYSTYYGGTGDESNSQIILYPNNQFFAITGLTNSGNVIGQNSTIQPLFGGGSSDNYLAVFNASNGVKTWGTFIGGTNDEYPSDIACSITNNVVRIYVIGQTFSPNNISTPGSYKATITNTTATDAFLQTYTTTTAGSNPNKIMGTYFGGSGAESFYDIDLDGQGNIYLFGATSSTNGIAISAYQNIIADNLQDCFYTKWDANLSSPLYSSYFGGTDIDNAYSICVDKNTGDFYIAGESYSQNLATNGTVKPQSTASGTTISDSYIAKISGNNGNKQICTYFGGSDDNAIVSVKIDNVNNIWIGGYTSSTNNIATTTAINNTNIGVGGFLAKLNQSLTTQLFGTYYGGTGDDIINAITLNSTGNPNIVWVCGTTNSNDFISYNNASQTTLGGSYDAFIGKIDNPCSFSVALGAGTSSIVCESEQIYISLVGNIAGIQSVIWTAPNASTYTMTNLAISGVSLSNSGTYNGLITFTNGCIDNISHSITVNPKPTIQINSNAAICTGKNYTISPGATNQYTVYAQGSPIGSGTSIVVSPTNATTYSIVGINSFNCVNSTTMNIAVTQSLLVTNQSSVAFNVFSTAKLYVTANLQNIQYQWQFDTSSTTTHKWVNLSNSSKYSGVNTDTLRVNNINFNDNNKYFRCELTSTDCGLSNTSTAINLKVGINIEVGVDEYISKIVIFPNPAKTELFINIPEYLLGSHVRVFDSIGKLQLEQELKNSSSYLNVKDWVNGMYTITIPETGKCFKLIKE